MQINADAIYVLSIPGSQRRRDIAIEMDKYGISYEMINAVPDESGIKGLQETMCAVLWMAGKNNLENALVFEDDVAFEVSNPVELINKAVEQLPKDYDILQFGCNLVAKPTRVSENLLSVSYSHATHASLYSKKAIQKVLDILDYETHLDALIHKHIQKDGKCYCSYPMIANQKDGYSDIERREVRYGTMMKKKFKQLTDGIASY